jgi:hypothetical protein
MRIRLMALILCLALFLSPPLLTQVNAATMTPMQGKVGTQITIGGLTPGLLYVVKWDGTDVKTGAVPTGGSIQFEVPETTGGSHTVRVETSGTTLELEGTFTVNPSITIDASIGNVGDTITVEGTGFGDSESDIEVTYDDTSEKTGITADDNGSWDADIAIPASTTGNHTIDASGSSTEAEDVADLSFKVSPKITLKPSLGGVGTEVIVTGTGFGSAETGIKVRYDGKDLKTGLVADVKGSWSMSFTVPSSIKGEHTVDSSGASTDASDVPDTIFTVSPTLIIEPTTGFVEDEIEIKGMGFATNEDGIKVTLDGKVVEDGIEADETGNWSATFIIPEVVNGTRTVDAYGDTTLAADVLNSSLDVQARVVLKPQEGNIGDTIYVYGTGFSKSKDVSVKYGETAVSTVLSTNTDGSFTTSFEAPSGVSGQITVQATDTEDVTASSIFSIETSPPDTPRVASPKDGARVGYLGDTKVTFDWTDVADPSGVTYSLQVSDQADFVINLVDLTDIKESQYTLMEAESLPPGKYYWRVKAIDGAGNEGEWTVPNVIKTAFVTVNTFIIIVVCVIAFIIILAVVPRLIIKLVKWSKKE